MVSETPFKEAARKTTVTRLATALGKRRTAADEGKPSKQALGQAPEAKAPAQGRHLLGMHVLNLTLTPNV